MELGKIAHRNHQDHPRGVALLISLSVILLLSIALMKNFEKRSLEVAHLGNNLERFQAESLSRSVFKVILISIKDQGLITLMGNRNYWQGINFPLGNGSFLILEVTPIDHRFYLNQKFGSDDPGVDVFKNMVRINKELAGGYNDSAGENEIKTLSAINDWVDRNQDMDEAFLFDSEHYYTEEPSFSVKNRDFERLSEIRLLPSFRALGIKAEYLEKNFRVLGESDEYVDVNLISEISLRAFLGRYENVDGFPHLYDRLDDMVKLILDQRPGEQGVELSDSERSAPFPLKSFQRSGAWFKKLETAGIELNTEEQELFKPISKTLFIRFQVQVGKATLNIRSIVQVGYRKESLDISSLKILSFRII